jgi:RND superfamily putative drug exporter
MFVIVAIGFAAIAVALEAVVMTVLSFAASFGILVAVFQYGRLERLLHYESVGTTDPLVPIIAGAIVFGLSMDYELFLLSRIKEDFNRTHDPIGSVARGLQSTAGIITSAAVVLLLVLIGFASARILFVKQLGVVMAIAVLLDATIVRALLVPAMIRLIGRWNWWSPAFLRRFLERFRIGIDER